MVPFPIARIDPGLGSPGARFLFPALGSADCRVSSSMVDRYRTGHAIASTARPPGLPRLRERARPSGETQFRRLLCLRAGGGEIGARALQRGGFRANRYRRRSVTPARLERSHTEAGPHGIAPDTALDTPRSLPEASEASRRAATRADKARLLGLTTLSRRVGRVSARIEAARGNAPTAAKMRVACSGIHRISSTDG